MVAIKFATSHNDANAPSPTQRISIVETAERVILLPVS